MKENDYSVLTDPDAVSINDWLAYLEKSSVACYFHTPFYCKALLQTSGLEPVFCCVLYHNEITALAIGECGSEIKLLPGITKRTIFYAEPLFEDDGALEILLIYLSSYRSGLFVQFRPFFPLTDNIILVFKSHGYQFSNHLNAYIPVTNGSKIFNNFEKDKKRGIKSASEKFGITIREFDDFEESVDRFYNIQGILYKKKRHAIKTKDYFYNILKTSKGHVKIIFAIYNNKPIASQLYTIFGNRLTAMYTGTLEEHRNKKAGDLLVWQMIDTALKNNIKYFDFGGGGDPDKPYAPRDYKRRFGTIFENSGRLTLPRSPFYIFAMSLYRFFLKH